MCVHANSFDGMGLTREERLMEMERVREHHRRLYQGYVSGGRAGEREWEDHLKAHREAAGRLRQQRTK